MGSSILVHMMTYSCIVWEHLVNGNLSRKNEYLPGYPDFLAFHDVYVPSPSGFIPQGSSNDPCEQPFI